MDFAVPLQDLRAHVQRPHQNADGASAQEEMARSRRAMIEGKSLAKPPNSAAFTRRPPSAGGVGFSARPLRQARMLRGIVEADETFRPRILQGPVVRSAAQGAQTRRNGQTSGPSSGQYCHSRRPRPQGRDLRRGPASGRQRFGRSRARRRRHAEPTGLIGDGGSGDRGFRSQGGDSRSRPMPAAGQADRRGARTSYQQRQRLPCAASCRG